MSESASTYPPGFLEQYHGDRLLAVSISFIFLEFVFVALRFYTRRTTESSKWGWDDIILLPALIMNLGMCSLGIVMVKVAGVGFHIPAVPPRTTYHWGQCLYALSPIYLTAVLLPKMSILFTYLRVFTHRTFRHTTYALMVIVIASWLGYGFAVIFQCHPVAFVWDKSIPGGTCINLEALYKAVNGPMIATDLVMIALPIPMVWHLKTTRLRKAGLTLAFTAGGIGTIVSCVRLAAFCQTDAYNDNTWASVSLVSWSIIEPGMYLIAACLPTLRPLVSRFSPNWLKALVSRRKTVSSTSTNSIRLTGTSHQNSKGGFTKLDGRDAAADRGLVSQLSGLQQEQEPLGYETKVNGGRENAKGVEAPSRGIGLTTNVDVDVENIDLDFDLESGQRRRDHNIF